MGKKADAREARKQADLERFERTKARLLSQVPNETAPRVQQLPQQERFRISTGVDPFSLTIPTQPKTEKSGESILNSVVTWCVRWRDVKGAWSWGEVREWTDEEWADEIAPKFAQFEQLLWREIDAQSSESGHKMHHTHELHQVDGEAQARWLDLGLEEFDTLFRFRLGGQRRFWGFRIGSHFFGVWWDRKHRIYPVD